jgi:hypothetical protein
VSLSIIIDTLLLEGEVVVVFNELVFAPIVEVVVVAKECERLTAIIML